MPSLYIADVVSINSSSQKLPRNKIWKIFLSQLSGKYKSLLCILYLPLSEGIGTYYLVMILIPPPPPALFNPVLLKL